MIGWSDYDGFAWATAKQRPMAGEDREIVASLAADILALADIDRGKQWGLASPPGRFAATVIRVSAKVSPKFAGAAAAHRIDELGVKIFKTTADAQKEARKLVPFHRSQIGQMPGLPHPHVQMSLDAGTARDARGTERGYVVQEWVPGPTLEDCVQRIWPNCPIEGGEACQIITQLLGKIVIPLWQKGTIWWDIRDANFCYGGEPLRLKMIDVDSLAAYAQEILEAGSRWNAREKGRLTALARLRQTILRILCAQRNVRKGRIEGALRVAWEVTLEPSLKLLGRRQSQDRECLMALDQFLQGLRQAGGFRSN